MKINDLIPKDLAFGFTYNKFTLPFVLTGLVLLIPIIYYSELQVLVPYMAFIFVLIFLPIYDKNAIRTGVKENKK